jgi:hypothetical protein
MTQVEISFKAGSWTWSTICTKCGGFTTRAQCEENAIAQLGPCAFTLVASCTPIQPTQSERNARRAR